jgi:hypothetical protein
VPADRGTVVHQHLWVHGQKLTPWSWKTRGGCSPADLNPVESVPPWRCPDGLVKPR